MGEVPLQAYMLPYIFIAHPYMVLLERRHKLTRLSEIVVKRGRLEAGASHVNGSNILPRRAHPL